MLVRRIARPGGSGQRRAHVRCMRRRMGSFCFPRTHRLALVPLLASALVLAGCSAQKKTRSVRVPVRVATAVEQPMPYTLGSVGSVEALRTAAVGSQVGGVVTRVSFREGDAVARGQVLIQIDPRPFRAVLDQAAASLARDRAQAETARLEAER